MCIAFPEYANACENMRKGGGKATGKMKLLRSLMTCDKKQVENQMNLTFTDNEALNPYFQPTEVSCLPR